MNRRIVRPAGQTDISSNTPLSAGEAGAAVAVAAGVTVVGQLIRGVFWGGLAALVVNFVSKGRRSRSKRRSR